MRFKADYEELNKKGIFISSKKEEIINTLNEIEKLFDEISTAWKGKDSNAFVNKGKEYTKSQINNTEKIENLSQLLKIFSSGYKNKDKEWQEEMKKELTTNDGYRF